MPGNEELRREHTQLVAASLRDAEAVMFAEVSRLEAHAGGMQQHAAHTAQGALRRYSEIARRVTLRG